MLHFLRDGKINALAETSLHAQSALALSIDLPRVPSMEGIGRSSGR
jgi:hypothetical protein